MRTVRQWLRSRLVVPVIAVLLLVAASPALAEIFVQEDFDDGNLASRGWYDIARWGTELFHSTSERVNGNGSLEVRYETGSTGPWLRHQFRGTDRIYTRYYRKWASNFRWPTTTGPHDAFIFGMYGQPYFAPTQTYVTIYTDAIYMGDPGNQWGTMGIQKRRYLQGESWVQWNAITPPPPRYELGRWYCVETMATMNTPGVADGQIQGWLDGQLIFDVRNALLRDSANAALQFDLFLFGPFFHGGTTQAQSTWIDALVIADERVGCLGDGVPPAAPTDLQVTSN